MSDQEHVEELFARWVERRIVHGERLEPADLCRDRPDLVEELRACIRGYEELQQTLDGPPEDEPPLPEFEGYRTIERLGRGGGGEVFKLEDVTLGRTVAAKVVREGGPAGAGLADFLREARSLALFADPRIVRLYEFRAQADPPLLLMEYVEGFELGRIGRSLEFAQRARILAEIAEAIDHAHGLGIQHRDLKPANVLLDSELTPRILDFGLSRGEPGRGHLIGTPAYMAPEQFDRSRSIDARTDVYALGVMLYELLCGAQPYGGPTRETLIEQACRGRPRLPIEIEPGVPEPLQAIALKAMERDPENRFATAREMALELRRFIEGRPVLARPTLYQSTLQRRVAPHLEQVREWLRLALIYPHEAERLTTAYRKLDARQDDWIVGTRWLSYSQITLYLGAFLLICGGLLYFIAYLFEAVRGMLQPLLVLGLPFVGLNVAAYRMDRGSRRAIAVAFYTGAVLLLPLLLLILFEEVGLWTVDPDNEREIFGEGYVSNRQLQLAALAACVWSVWLGRATRTVALSTFFTVLLFVFHLTLLADRGLRDWLEAGDYHLLALHLVPLLLIVVLSGMWSERGQQPWFSGPLYVAAAILFVAVLELLALNGKAFEMLGLSLAPLQTADVTRPLLLDTLTAMTLNGLLIYGAGRLAERRGTPLMHTSAWMLISISPFAILHPVGHINFVDEYSPRFLWVYLALALGIALLSHYRQRKSFYFAGLFNTGAALWYITYHYDWFDRPAWAVAVVATGLGLLGLGLALALGERARRVGGGRT